MSDETAVLQNPERLLEWRMKWKKSLVPLARILKCTVIEASRLERGKPVESELVERAEDFLLATTYDE